MDRLRKLGLVGTLVIILPLYAILAQGDENLQKLEDLKKLNLEDLYKVKVNKISLATRMEQSLDKAPAVATVITSEEIEAMGATDLDQVLETVPGLHVALGAVNYSSSYVIRGVYTTYNPQVLMLINGMPLTNLGNGSRASVWGGMPINDIARIEVIRGPASAVYGSDAVTGIINVITKSKDDINGTEVGGRLGSFNTKDAWILHGSTWAGIDVAFAFETHNTDGHQEIIQADAQTFLDQLKGTDASLAPGSVNLMKNNIDGTLSLKKDLWQLRLGYQRRDNGTGAGVSSALDPAGRVGSTRFYTDLVYDAPHFTDNWGVTVQTNFLYTTQQAFEPLTLFPSNPTIGFPVGMIVVPEIYEKHHRLNISGLYSGFDKHKILLGTGYFYADAYRVKHRDNFSPNLVTGEPGSATRQLADHSDTSNAFFPEAIRKNWDVFAQDVWTLTDTLELTTGIRYDNYADFGNTVNPRLALVWQTSEKLSTKLLYGEAFRAPTIYEMFITSSPTHKGNPSLKPETIQTVELAFSYRPDQRTTLGFNLFKYKLEDMIEFVFDGAKGLSVAQNSGAYEGQGFELEGIWQTTRKLRIQGNYAFQKTIARKVDQDAGNAPRHHVYLRSDWEFVPNWFCDTQLNWVGGRERPTTDLRAPIDDYLTADLVLRYKRDKWNVALSARNIFDTDAREISPGNDLGSGTSIPYDFPLAGRNYFLEVSYHF